MRVAYYPGCTGTQTSLDYEESVRETAGCLGIQLEDIAGWTCCGAGSAHVVDETLALTLPALNILRAREMGLGLVTPCPACALRHQTTECALQADASVKAKVEEGIGAALKPGERTKHFLELLHRDVGTEEISKRVRRPLAGLRVAAYYGCYLVRPPEIVCGDDPEAPMRIDDIVASIGAEAVDWSYKVDCCGGSAAVPATQMVRTLTGRILEGAREAGADAIVTACPMCQANLDMFQSKNTDATPLPVLYFSELTALAFGSVRVADNLAKHFADPSPLLEGLGLLGSAE